VQWKLLNPSDKIITKWGVKFVDIVYAITKQ